MQTVIEPIGGAARHFLRQVNAQMGAIRAMTEEELHYAADCVAAGYLVHVRGSIFLLTEKGIAYLDRLARCE